ncbi:hypothetical protein TSAR_010889 [Trichomalopsis sarcophagae]|uniref:Uncharacterized protein n=1 Tax=Trichomalopsis sarcophagae TaxID=543379 RepID=A0A232ENU4_9HYME|nr:hypothetical protein TSAR_010889 [Trichomalopsis sarcophagae]
MAACQKATIGSLLIDSGVHKEETLLRLARPQFAKITVEFSSFKESVRSFLLVSLVSDQFYESRLAKTTSGIPLFLLNSRYGGRAHFPRKPLGAASVLVVGSDRVAAATSRRPPFEE